MKVTTIGMNLAKTVIPVHGVGAHGKTALQPADGTASATHISKAGSRPESALSALRGC